MKLSKYTKEVREQQEQRRLTYNANLAAAKQQFSKVFGIPSYKVEGKGKNRICIEIDANGKEWVPF